ncbi:MAG TPA: carboxypeptidase regulatory-like domain-containing protein [Pyrinomonadaceae bacterium]|nr:carboxypeptidase regulatory-like domain-containing protein [Pyrinomonadaceae bacterium]
MCKQKLTTILFTIVLTMCFGSYTVAQEVTGSVVGTVRDTAGASIPGATVSLSIPSQGDVVIRTITANDQGVFTIPSVPVNTYKVTVEAANFKRSVVTDIKVDLGQRRSVDVVLEAGDISEVVTVEADRVAVEGTTPTASTVINGDQVRELSINNRNFVQLVTLAPGVTNDLSDQVYVGTTNPEGQANIVSIAVNGARSSQNTFTVDGADVTDRGSNITIQAYPSVDSIGEFRVLRSLYPAESGRSGGGQVNIVTRSGASRINGSVYYFFRNESLNANDVLTNSTPSLRNTLGVDPETDKVKRRPFRYRNYGYTVGGPIPLYKGKDGWNKTFFFFSQEFRADLRFPTLVSTVPTQLQRNAQFNVPICLQATGTTCTTVLPGTAAAPGQLTNIDPVAQQYLQFVYRNLPLPNTGVNSLNFPTEGLSDFRQEVVKVDHAFNDKLSGYYRYQQDSIPTIDANSLFSSGSGLPGVSTTSTDSPGRTHTVQMAYAAGSNLVIEGRYTFGYGAILSQNIGLLALSRSAITPPMAYPVTRDRVPTISGNGFSALQSFGPYDNFSWKGNAAGSVTYIAGNHTMKFGAVYSKYRKNENALGGNNEGLFSGFNTPGATGNVIAPGGNATQQLWANFLMGTNVTFTQASFDYTADLRQRTFEWFAQDEWRVRRNLTLYYGVRYSFFGSPYDKNGRLSNFVPELYNRSNAPLVTGAGNRVPGTGNFCEGIIVNAQNTVPFPNCNPTLSPWGRYVVKSPKNDYAPRVGLAWDPWGNGKTSVRTGYGIYHEQILNGIFLQNIATNPPYQQTCQVVGTRLSNPVPGGCAVIAANTVASLRAVQAEWETPYMQHWSLDIQRQLFSRTLVSIGYYGSKGTNLIGGFGLNSIKPGVALASQCAVGASTTPTVACQQPNAAFFSTADSIILDQIRPYRGYRSIAIIQPRFNSNYDSLQVSGQHRFTGSSQLNLAYTWSKNLSDNRTDRSNAPQNSFDIGSEKGRAALDRRHVLTINYVYELPFFRGQKGFVGRVLGGWQASGIITYQTGLGFTPTVSGFDPSGIGLVPTALTVARPNLTCNPNQGAPQTIQQWFNTACFQITPINNSTPSANVPGNGGINIIEGPSTKRVDFTLSKNLRFTERFRLQLRGEAFNVFNWTNPRGLSTVVWSATTQPVAQGGNGSSTFGQVTSFRDPRIIQLGAKISF